VLFIPSGCINASLHGKSSAVHDLNIIGVSVVGNTSQINLTKSGGVPSYFKFNTNVDFVTSYENGAGVTTASSKDSLTLPSAPEILYSSFYKYQ